MKSGIFVRSTIGSVGILLLGTVGALVGLPIIGQLMDAGDDTRNSTRTTVSSQYTEAYTWAVRSKLEDLNLHHRLRAISGTDGAINVIGQISSKEEKRWNSFREWYQARTGYPVLKDDVRVSEAARDLPEIKSVWLDQSPTVFFQDGSKGGIGERIADGWTIVYIDRTAVLIERDGATITLAY